MRGAVQRHSDGCSRNNARRGINADFSTEAAGGILRLELPELSEKDRHNADMILETMLCGVADLYEGYSTL